MITSVRARPQVLAFPCNQFGGQEPGTSEEILSFVSKYGVTFPMFEKVDVNGVRIYAAFHAPPFLHLPPRSKVTSHLRGFMSSFVSCIYLQLTTCVAVRAAKHPSALQAFEG